MTETTYRSEAIQEWMDARSKALWVKLRAYVQRKDINLKDFEVVAKELGLLNPRYRGLQEIPLEQIVGSVGRYKDFITHFLPTTRSMEERWAKIAALYLDPVSGGVPPIEAYKVGNSYFVKDGNHRVSVANQLEMPTIEAYVWEYPLPEGLDENADIDTLLREAEKRDFFELTQLDEEHHAIHLALPGGYRELLHQIAAYRPILEKIDGKPFSLPEAAAAWFDLMYEPSVQIIRREGVMDDFPERTPADLYIWINRERNKLEETYGHSVRITDTLRVLESRQRNLFNRLRSWLAGWLPHAD